MSIEMTEMNKFDRAYNESWYTITGCGGDLNEWKKGYIEMLNDSGIGTPKKWIDFTGKEMNEMYDLVDKNKYPDDLHFLAFSLEGLNVGKLAMFKLRMEDRWFDDIVDNNARRNEN